MTAHHHACCGCEGKDPCCTGIVARLPDDAGSATATLSVGYSYTFRIRYRLSDGSTIAEQTGDLSLNATVTFGLTETPWSGDCAGQRAFGGEGVGSITSASFDVSTPGGSSVTPEILESAVALHAIPASADPTRYALIASGYIKVQLDTGADPWVWSTIDSISIAVYYRPLDGKSYTVVGVDPDIFEVPTNPVGGEPLATNILCFISERICNGLAVFPAADSLSASASGSFERFCSTNAFTSTIYTHERSGSASASLNVSGIGWTACPGKTLPDAEAADCNDPDVIECRDANGNPRDERCCDPINPLPPDDPRCAVISGAACCPTPSGLFLADDAYAVLVAEWFYRQVTWATSPNRWVPLQVFVGSAALRIALPRSGSPQCAFRASGAALIGGPNQTSLTGEAPISVRYINNGTEISPDWQPANRYFSSAFTVGHSTSANFLHRIHNTTGNSSDLNVNIQATTSSCLRGSQTRPSTGWTLTCSQGEWPALGSGFWQQFTMRDVRAVLPTDGSITGTQWDGSIDAALRVYRMGVCPSSSSMLTVGLPSPGGPADLLALHAGFPARVLASLADQPALRGVVERTLTPRAPSPQDLDPRVRATLARQFGGCKGCGDPGVLGMD